jgi:hypothetical protein
VRPVASGSRGRHEVALEGKIDLHAAPVRLS